MATTTNAQPYTAHTGSKALAASGSRVIAAQHMAAATTKAEGVREADMPARAMALGIDLRAARWGRPDWSYSARTTPATTRSGRIGAVHVFAHSEALANGSPVACIAGHKGSEGPCDATAPNVPGYGRAYRLDACDGFAEVAAALDSEGMHKVAAAAFGALVAKAVAAGYSEAARLAATPGVAQFVEYGGAYAAAFAKATKPAKPAK